jgi:hypothetical protein
MGRYVLLEFDDNTAAESFVNKLTEIHQEGIGEFFTVTSILAAHSTIQAVFSKPSGLCSCAVRSEKSLHGSKFKWWVCPTCKRPKPHGAQFLPNMLDEEGIPTRDRELHLTVKWYIGEDGSVRTARSGYRP